MFGEDSKKILEPLLAIGRQAGADVVEIFLENRTFLNVLAENGKITAVAPVLSVGAGVRVIRDRADSYASTNQVDAQGLQNALCQALEMLGLSWPQASTSPAPEVTLEPLRDYGQQKGKDAWLRGKGPAASGVSATPPVELLCDTILACQRKQLSIAHRQSATTSGFWDCQEVLVAASDGVFARDVRLHQTLSAQVVCEDGAHRFSCHRRLGAASDPDFFQTLDHTALVSALAQTAGHMLRADYVTSGEYPVVLSHQFGGVIFHEACGHLLETTAVQKNSTPFAHAKNKLIAHPNLTAWDEGFWDKGFGSLDMDDEGMPTQKTLLIENGVLKNFLCDRMGERLTGHPRTGSGRRQNYAFAPASRMRNTYIDGGSFTKNDLIASIPKGLYCKNLGGGSVSSTGDFNFGVEEAWLIEDGKLTKPVKGATLIGQAPAVLPRISMCANDLDVAAGFCGSVSGSVYVTVGQPHIKVDMMTVGGRL